MLSCGIVPTPALDPRALPIPEPWLEPVQAWRLHLLAAGRSPATVYTRMGHIGRLARAMPAGAATVTSSDLVGWAAGQSWARETRRSVYATVRGFFGWCVTEGRLESSPAARLPEAPAGIVRPRPIPGPALEVAQRAAGPRTLLILRLAATMGLRRAEIAQVHRRDLLEDLAGWSLVVHGKGGKTRDVPMPAALAATVMAAALAGGGYVFPGDDAGHLSPRYVGFLASKVLPDGWSLHTLRHRFASMAYAGSSDLLAVQQLLGHASPATTQRYVAVSDRARRAAMEWAA